MNPETFSLIYLLKSEIHRNIVQNNFLAVNKQLRHFISLCNSIQVKLIQTGSFSEIEFIKKKSDKADKLIIKYGSQADKFWQGRLVSWLIDAYYSLLTNQHQKSLETMYKIHLLIEDLQDAGGILNTDIKIVSSFLSFIILWTSNRIETCEDFLNISKKTVENEKNGRRRIGKLDLDEMTILNNMSFAALLIRFSGNSRSGLKVLSEMCEKFRGCGLVSYKVLIKFLASCCKEQEFSYSGEYGNADNLVTDELQRVLLDICIVPFIEEDCPIIENQIGGLNKTIKSPKTHSDKVSTRSTYSRSSRSDSKYKNVRKLVNVCRPRIIPGKLNIYSPIVGVIRPKSHLKVFGPGIPRPKSTEKNYFAWI